jgi:hypothetical protein
MATATQKTTQDKVKASLDRLEKGIEELLQSGKWQDYLRMQSRLHTYSYRNVVLILLQSPEAVQVAGFNTWKGLNRFVKKGEKGIGILAPLIRKSEENEGEKILFGFKTVNVFDISQTEGEPLPSVCSQLTGNDPELLQQLMKVATDLGIPTTMKEIEHNGYCRFEGDRAVEIVINSGLTSLQQCKTLAHELGHAILHSEEDYRKHSQRSLRELEAESVAFCTLNYFEIDTSGYSFGYISEWANQEDAIQQLKSSGEQIQKAVCQILEALKQ